MKKMLLTGLATEQSFTAEHSSMGAATYYLVFNNGELRIQVTESGAEEAIKAMVSEDGVSEEAPQYEERPQDAEDFIDRDRRELATDDDGVDQV